MHMLYISINSSWHIVSTVQMNRMMMLMIVMMLIISKMFLPVMHVGVQSPTHVPLFVIPWTAAC